jgi:hypothetical protein
MNSLKLVSGLGFCALLAAGCGATDATESITVSGTLALSTLSSYQSVRINAVDEFRPQAISDYRLYCVTFAAVPAASTSEFDSAGAFSTTVPANTPFGCFVNSKTTNLPVATLISVDTAATGLSSGKSSSFSLSGDTLLGALTLDLAAGTVEIPIARLAGTTSAASAASFAADMHGKTYTMSCVSSGSTEIDALCNSFIADNSGASVYFRVLKGTKADGSTIFGLGVWQSSTAFTNCGAKDMSAATYSSILSEEAFSTFTLADGSAIAQGNWTVSGNSDPCRARDQTTSGSVSDQEDVSDYYALGGLEPIAGGYALRGESEYVTSGCTYSGSFSLSLTGTASEIYGSMTQSDSRSGTCNDGVGSETSTFPMKFTAN